MKTLFVTVSSSITPADFQTGKSVTFPYLRNTRGVRQHADSADHDQRYEPFGKFVLFNEAGRIPEDTAYTKWESGTVTVHCPLVLDAQNWKTRLSADYAKTGKGLTKALKAAGYDAVVTKDKYGIGEIVLL